MSVQKYWYLLGPWDIYARRFVNPDNYPQWDNVKGGFVNRQTIEEAPKITWSLGGAQHFFNTGRDFMGKYGRHPDYPNQLAYSYTPVDIPIVQRDPRGKVTSEIVYSESQTPEGFPAIWFEGEAIATPVAFFDHANPGPGVTAAEGQLEFYRNTLMNFDATGFTNGVDREVDLLAVKLPDYMAGSTTAFFYSLYLPSDKIASRFVKDAEWAYMMRRHRTVSMRVGTVTALEEVEGGSKLLIYVDVQPGTHIPWGGVEGVDKTLVDVIADRGDDTLFVMLSQFPFVSSVTDVPARDDGVFDYLLEVISYTDNSVVFLFDNQRTVFNLYSDVYINLVYDTVISTQSQGAIVHKPAWLYDDAPKCCYFMRQESVPSIDVNEEDPNLYTCYRPFYEDPFVDSYPFDEEKSGRDPYTGLTAVTSCVFYSGDLKFEYPRGVNQGLWKKDYYAPEPALMKTTTLMSRPCAIYELMRDSTFDPEAYVSDDHYISYKYHLDYLYDYLLDQIIPVGLVSSDSIFYHHNQDVFLDEAITQDNLIFRVLLRDLSGNPVDIEKVSNDNLFEARSDTVACKTKAIKYNLKSWQPIYEVPYPFQPAYITKGYDLYDGGTTFAEFSDTLFLVYEDYTTFHGLFTYRGPLKNDPATFQGGYVPYRLTDGAVVGSHDAGFPAAVYQDYLKPHFSVFLERGGLPAFDRIVHDVFGNYNNSGSRTVIAGFKNGEHFGYARPTKGYTTDTVDGVAKIRKVAVPAGNGIINGSVGQVLPAGDLEDPDVVVDDDGDEHWGNGNYAVPVEHTVLGAYWESSVAKIIDVLEAKLPVVPGYLLNGYMGLHVRAGNITSSPYNNQPLIDSQNSRVILSLCFLEDTHPLVHIGGNIVEAVPLNGLGEIIYAGPTGARYKAIKPGIEVIAAKDNYNNVVVYIGIYNMPKRFIAMLDSNVEGAQNFTPTDVFEDAGQTAGESIGSIHSIERGTAGASLYGDLIATLEDSVMLTSLDDYRSFPVAGFDATGGLDDDSGTDTELIIGNTIEPATAGVGFVFGNAVTNVLARLRIVVCSLDMESYESTRIIYVNFDGPFASDVELRVGYQPTTATGVNNPFIVVPGATLKAVKREEDRFIIDLSASLYGIPLGLPLAVALYDPITEALSTWLKVAEALPPLNAPVDADAPTLDISSDTIGSGEEGPTLL